MLVIVRHLVSPIQNVLSTPWSLFLHSSSLILRHLCTAVLGICKFLDILAMPTLLAVHVESRNHCLIYARHVKNFLAVSC
jgi:hypothetical protein